MKLEIGKIYYLDSNPGAGGNKWLSRYDSSPVTISDIDLIEGLWFDLDRDTLEYIATSGKHFIRREATPEECAMFREHEKIALLRQIK